MFGWFNIWWLEAVVIQNWRMFRPMLIKSIAVHWSTLQTREIWRRASHTPCTAHALPARACMSQWYFFGLFVTGHQPPGRLAGHSGVMGTFASSKWPFCYTFIQPLFCPGASRPMIAIPQWENVKTANYPTGCTWLSQPSWTSSYAMQRLLWQQRRNILEHASTRMIAFQTFRMFFLNLIRFSCRFVPCHRVVLPLLCRNGARAKREILFGLIQYEFMDICKPHDTQSCPS